MWLISLPAGISSLENWELSWRISSIALIQEHLSKVTRMLSLSDIRLTMFLLFGKRLRALNSEGVTFWGGSQSLEKFCYEAQDVSNSLALIKDLTPLHKFSCFMSQNNNSNGSRNFEYSGDPGLTEKLRPLHKTFFSSLVNSYEEKLKITLSELWISLKILYEEIFKRFCNFHFFCIVKV